MLVVLLVLPRITPQSPPCWWPSSAPPSCRPCSTSPPTASRPSARSRRAARRRRCRGRSSTTSGRCSSPRVGITLVSLTDTIATASSFAARRGEEVDPNQEMIGMGAPTSPPGFFQGFAVSTSGSRTAVAEQSGAKSQLTGLVGAGVVVDAAALPQLAARRPARRRRSRPWSSPRPLSLMTSRRCAATGGCGARPLLLSLVGDAGVIVFGVLQGIVIADRPVVLLFFHRSWWPHGAVLGRVDGIDGWHSVDGQRDASRSCRGIVVYRWEAPLFFANAGPSASRCASSSASASRAGSCCSARPSPTSTSPRRRCSSSSTASSTARVCTSPSSSCATGSRTWSLRYGLFETLDRDHFYPSDRRWRWPRSPTRTRRGRTGRGPGLDEEESY